MNAAGFQTLPIASGVGWEAEVAEAQAEMAEKL